MFLVFTLVLCLADAVVFTAVADGLSATSVVPTSSCPDFERVLPEVCCVLVVVESCW